ncbi:MAG: c-type cytochrome, partial [Planctomycetales bacterium]|nr:c-type cytochrome [Planctomycetales bacterium]
QTVIVDMHRAVIEHPQWVPDELKNRPDERWGDAAGRVYWVGRENRLPAVLDSLRAAPLGQRNDQQLVALVADENPWMRQTATRLLLEREAADTAQALMQQAHDGQLGTAGRIASLRLAANLLHQLPPQTAELFTSDNKALALVALRVAQNFPASLPQHATAIAALASSDSGPLQFEALLCLGILSAHDKAVASQVDIEPLAEQLASSDEPLLLMAAGSAFRHQPEVLLHTWLSALTTSQAALPPSNFLGDVARSLVAAALRAETDLQQTMALAQRAATAGDSPRGQLAALAAVQQFVQSRPQDAMFDEAFWSSMADLLSAPDITSDAQVVAINILGRSPREEDAQRLGELVQENSNPSLAEPLLQAWAGTNSVDSDRYLVDSLATAAPHMQRAMLALVGARPQRLELLVEQLEAGKLTARQIGAAELKKLVARAQGATQKTLQHHLSQITNSNRAQVIESYKPSLALKADVTRGVEVFRKHCASCHRIGEIGVQVGPDISDSRTKQPLELLGSILDPNLAIDNNYFRFVVLTEDDRVIEGIIAEETADAIVLRGQDDKRELIRREDIVELKATGVSLMPEGIEAQIDHQAMADLIGFIKGWRYVDGAIPKL